MIKNILHRILLIITNKFLLVFAGFAIWIAFFDQQNLIDRQETKKHLKALQEDTLYYQQRIRQDEGLIRELKTNQENLEKFAREQYLMKAPDEDVYVILKDEAVK